MFKVKQRVAFTGRTTSGNGRIKAIKTTTRGVWYVIDKDSGGEIKCRAAHITAI